MGALQAETLGNLFRNVMYPPSAGGGLLRLHSTYRHDLKIYSSGQRAYPASTSQPFMYSCCSGRVLQHGFDLLCSLPKWEAAARFVK